MKPKITDRSIYIVAALMAAAWVLASVLLTILKVNLAVRIVIGLVPVGLLVYQIVLSFRYVLGQDEFQRKIILEGLATAFAIALPVIFVIGFVMRAGVRLPFQFMDSGYFMEVALLVGYAVAYRRHI